MYIAEIWLDYNIDSVKVSRYSFPVEGCGTVAVYHRLIRRTCDKSYNFCPFSHWSFHVSVSYVIWVLKVESQ